MVNDVRGLIGVLQRPSQLLIYKVMLIGLFGM